MTKDELKLAFQKAFQMGQDYWYYANHEFESYNKKSDAIRAKFNEMVKETIEEALAQPDQDEVDIRSRLYQRIHELETQLAREEQEPVAVVDVHEFYDNCANFSLLQKLPKGKHTLYTTPPQRTWVDLTDDEMLMIYGQDHEGKKYNLGRMVQQSLKEKNT